MAYQGFQNATPFAAEPFLLNDEEGATALVLVAKATYDIARSTDGGLDLSADQAPIVKAPRHRGDPAESSLAEDTDATFGKAATDLILTGHAQPERGRVDELDVVLQVGRLEKRVRVFGDRVWKRTLGLYSTTAPRPFDRMPLVWERAFGGWDRSPEDPREHTFEPRNPVGKGYFHAFDADDPHAEIEGAELPNLEDPSSLIAHPFDRPPPACFSWVAPGWAPRSRLAGTFDEAWRERRSPRLPVDFDRRHNNSAPADLQATGPFRGGERVSITGASERGALAFSLPKVDLEASMLLRGGPVKAEPMRLDTLIIDTDAHRVSLVFRASFPVHRRTHDLVWSRIAPAEGHGAR